ncbi:hypothetical protein [Paraburkholderia ferrariae]|uniref:hypothetical protein n=1 Tax=Paraburkholderia ferrariae TaxID=386056 RepID=UPI000693DF39|nr:hypothetical protein [Paraburkholderia ferrariae]
METLAFRMVLAPGQRDDHTLDALPQLPIKRKWWDFMADIMQTGEGNVPVQPPLVPLFHLP